MSIKYFSQLGSPLVICSPNPESPELWELILNQGEKVGNNQAEFGITPATKMYPFRGKNQIMDIEFEQKVHRSKVSAGGKKTVGLMIVLANDSSRCNTNDYYYCKKVFRYWLTSEVYGPNSQMSHNQNFASVYYKRFEKNQKTTPTPLAILTHIPPAGQTYRLH